MATKPSHSSLLMKTKTGRAIRSADGISRLSKRAAQDILAYADDLRGDQVSNILQYFCEKESETWKNYMALHSAVRRPLDTGDGAEYAVVLNPNPVYAPPVEVRESTDKVKRYTLAQLFTDSHVRDKYALSLRFMNSMRAMAVTRPADAAAIFQQRLQETTNKVVIRVEAGGYARTRHQAITTVRGLANAVKLDPPPPEADVIKSQVFVYGPGVKGTGWYVIGPTKHLPAVMDVYKLATFKGMYETMFLLSMETQLLGIDIWDGDKVVSPIIISHASLTGVALPRYSDEFAISALSELALDRMRKLSVNVRPVEGEDGIVASAVYVGGNMLLVNDHIKGVETELFVDQHSVQSGGYAVSKDMWLHLVSGSYEPWTFRPPVVGEAVALLYHNGTDVVLSASFSVLMTNSSNIMSELCPDIVPGMSGGALVALSDMSFLGIHSGATARYLFASAYTDTMHEDMMGLASRYREDQVTAETSSAALVTHLRSRGLNNLLVSVCDRIVGLSSREGSHLGTALRLSGKIVSTVPSGNYYIDGTQHEFVHDVGMYAASPVMGEVSLGRIAVRKAQMHERVVVIACDGADKFISYETLVRQVSVGGSHYYLDSTDGNLKSLVGGVVFSVQDGSVLGMYVRDAVVNGMGKLSMCLPMPEYACMYPYSGMPLVDAVQRRIPSADVSRWNEVLLKRAFGIGGGIDNKNMATAGRAVIRARLYSALNRNSTPASQWPAYEYAALDDSSMSRILGDLMLTYYIEDLSVGPTVAADVLASIVNIVSEFETPPVLDSILEFLGMVPKKGEFRGPYGEYGGLMRRDSEIGFKQIQSDGTVRLISPID